MESQCVCVKIIQSSHIQILHVTSLCHYDVKIKVTVDWVKCLLILVALSSLQMSNQNENQEVHVYIYNLEATERVQ